jgi:photosystem II stability/assembly factor-like uncharacterized protein
MTGRCRPTNPLFYLGGEMMQNRNQMLKGFMLGVLVVILVVMTIGAVNQRTKNHAGDLSTIFRSVYASQDGRIVYVCDDSHVYRSADGGNNWTVVLKKSDKAGY